MTDIQTPPSRAQIKDEAKDREAAGRASVPYDEPAHRIRARFYVSQFNETAQGLDPTTGKSRTSATVVMNAVTRKLRQPSEYAGTGPEASDGDNVQWSEYSPSGQFTIVVTQKAGGAYNTFHDLLGKDVRITIEEWPSE
jgi:hypothetical protein